MHKISAKNKLATAVALASSVIAADMALASEIMLEEVVVTARKRSEDLQDVPMAVSAFTANQLQSFGIDELTEVGRMTPNLVMNETSGLVGGAISVFIRGIGNDQGLEQGVGVYVDDVYLNRTSGALLDVFDVERIEVLKGPQGNLYGRNTIGGAIKYITRDPGDELEANVEVKAGTDEFWRIKGGASGPVTDSLGAGLHFSYRERDGFQDNSFKPSDDPWDAETGAIRGALVWQAMDDLQFKLTADYSKDDSLPPVPRRIALDEGTLSQINTFIFDANTFYGPGTAPVDSLNDLGFTNDEDDIATAFTDGYDQYEIEQTTVAFTAMWDFSDQWMLKSVTAGRFLEQTQPFDFDGSEQVWINTLRDDLESDDYSQELQLNFNGETIAAVMGVYYLNAEQTQGQNYTLQTVRLRGTQINEKTTFRDDRDLESYSVYGNVDWDFADDWQLSLGARYTEDEKEETQEATVVEGNYAIALTEGSALPLAIAPGQEEFVEMQPAFTAWLNPRFIETSRPENTKAKKDWDEFTPSLRLSHHFSDDTMAYTGYSSGFKSGGFNNSNGNADPYDPETVDSYFVGLKSTLFDSTLRINTELFYNEYDDKQAAAQQLTAGGELARIVSNVGEVTQWGGEFELSYLPPIEGLLINFNVGYLDSDVDEFNVTGDDGSISDISDITELGYAPEWSGQLRATYDIDLGSTGFLTLGSDVSYLDDMYTNSPIIVTNPVDAAQRSDSYYLWNAVVAWRSPDEHWRVAVEGKNLNDEREIVNTFDIDLVATAGYTAPRTWLFSVGYTF